MRRVLVALTVLVAGGVLSGCTSPRDVLGPKESPCYRAIAVAKLAVRGAGSFSGVRELSVKSLLAALEQGRPGPSDIPVRLVRAQDGLCLVAYRGRYSDSNVTHAWPLDPAPDRYAVVVVREAEATVVTTILVRKAPLRLTKVFPPLL